MENNIAATKEFIDPKMILDQLDIAKNNVAADFGCGSGYFSIPMARKIPDGKLYSLDVLPAALESVASRAKIEGLTNIITTRVNLEKEGGSKLENESLDWVILKDMLFQNKSKDIILREAFRVLKPGGKLLAVEWNAQSESFGPQNDLKISEENLEKLIVGEKFKIEKKINAGNFHYGFMAVK